MDAFRINVKDLVLVTLEADGKDAPTTYSEIYDEIPGLMTIAITPQQATGSLYGDGAKRDEQAITTSCEITMEHNKWPLHLVAKYTGSEIVGGVMRTNTSDQAPYFAMGFKTEQTGEHVELTWFLKCKISPADKNKQQKTENVNYSTDNWKVVALALDYNGDIMLLADTSDPDAGFTHEMAETWLESVPVLPPKGTSETP